MYKKAASRVRIKSMSKMMPKYANPSCCGAVILPGLGAITAGMRPYSYTTVVALYVVRGRNVELSSSYAEIGIVCDVKGERGPRT